MTPFYRLSGAGNDFIVLTEPGEEPSVDQIRAWCARGLSEGADGLIVLRRDGNAVRMTYFNSDGGRAALCLNGTRCAARLATELGWADSSVEILTDAGLASARTAGPNRIAVSLRPPRMPRAIELTLEPDTFSGFLVDAGVPHLVLPWSASLAETPVALLGPPLRSHADLPSGGANVDFARYTRVDRLELRSFERGVEGETLACGTGILAAVAVGVATGELTLPCSVLTAGGFVFEIEGRVEAGLLTAVTMTGDARIVARGELLPGAASLPPGPAWTR